MWLKEKRAQPMVVQFKSENTLHPHTVFNMPTSPKVLLFRQRVQDASSQNELLRMDKLTITTGHLTKPHPPGYSSHGHAVHTSSHWHCE